MEYENDLILKEKEIAEPQNLKTAKNYASLKNNNQE